GGLLRPAGARVGAHKAPVAAAAPAPAQQRAANPPPQSDDLSARATEVTQAPATQAGNAQCDVQACSGMYRSFRASDCTYQPYAGGPRQMCAMGGRQQWTPVARTSSETTGAGPSTGGASAQCNVEACSRFYSSFNPSDCTYQPFHGGARQLCER